MISCGSFCSSAVILSSWASPPMAARILLKLCATPAASSPIAARRSERMSWESILTLKVRMDSQLIRSERLAAIGELAAGVAHNFNNILAAIGGDAQLLKITAEEQKLPQEIIDSAEMIYNETMRGGRIAHDLLSFARGQEPQLQSLDVRAAIADTVRLVSNYPASKNVVIESTVGEHLPRVEADAHQLHQVFFNMILNAVQAM